MTDPISTIATSAGKEIVVGASKGILQTLNDIWYVTYGHKWDEKAQELKMRQTIKLENLKKDLENNIDKIAEENLQDPKLSVVGPALEAAKFYMDEDEIRQIFAKLIASSMDKTQNEYVHPSFVEMIKMLSELDAKNLYYLYTLNDETISKVRIEFDEGGYTDIYTHVYLGNPETQDNSIIEPSIDNLIRLKLIDVSYDEFKNDETLYDKHRNNKLYLSYKNNREIELKHNKNMLDLLNSKKLIIDENTKAPLPLEIQELIKKQLENSLKKSNVIIVKGKISLTALGRNFCKVCL